MKLYLGIGVKEAVAVSLVALLIVAGTTAVHLAQLTRVVVEEAGRQAELVARQIYAQSGRAIARGPRRDPEDLLRRDGELRGFLDSSVGYSPHLLYVLIAGRAGRIIVHTERQREGTDAPFRPSLTTLLNENAVSRFLTLYHPGQTYEVVLPMNLNGAPFGSIRLGLSTTLLRREVNSALEQSLTLAALSLPLAWLVAWALARLMLKPLRSLTREVGRLARGEFEIAPSRVAHNEFQELSGELQRLGQQLETDRMAMLSERAHVTVQSLVSYSHRLAALGRLTSGVAHEVKNPLNAMMIHLELLKERLDAPSSEVQQSLEVIGGEIRRLDRVVQGFLRFTRPHELDFKPIEVATLLQSAVVLVEAEWQSQGIRFSIEMPPGLPPLEGDEELLRQALLNLIQNACQAMTKAGVVTVGARVDGDTLLIEVADEGVGIAPEEVERIFTLYYTTKPEGTGIGLSVVYRIVQMHDGSIDVRSELGRGTTMTIRLPFRVAQ
ncbi:MAG TPA: ATP-binding protein [Methylomirabilota bacterium]